MKLKVVIIHEIEPATNVLCGRCAHAEHEWPLNYCRLFDGTREKSETEDIESYMRLPACIERATP